MAHLLRSGLNVQFSGLDMLTPLLRLALLRHLRNVFWELAENMHTIMCVDMLHLTPGQRQFAQAAGLCPVAGVQDAGQSDDQQADH